MPFKVTDFSTNRKLVYKFLLVISSSSSSSRNECYLGGIVALLLQDHRTVSLKTD